jgi:hypothetical protein
MKIIEAVEKHDKILSFHFSLAIEVDFVELVLYVLKTNPLGVDMKLMSVSGHIEDSPIIVSELEGYLYEEKDLRTYTFSNVDKTVLYDIYRNFHKKGGSYQVVITVNTSNIGFVDLDVNWILSFYNKFPFIVGYVYDKFFVRLQSDTQPIAMRVCNIDLSEYKDKLTIDQLGHETLDLSNNYARNIIVGKMRLMASWRMYITKEFENLIGHDFVIPEDHSQYSDYMNFRIVEFYKNPFESHLNENLDRLRKVRQLNNFDFIEKNDNKSLIFK